MELSIISILPVTQIVQNIISLEYQVKAFWEEVSQEVSKQILINLELVQCDEFLWIFYNVLHCHTFEIYLFYFLF